MLGKASEKRLAKWVGPWFGTFYLRLCIWLNMAWNKFWSLKRALYLISHNQKEGFTAFLFPSCFIFIWIFPPNRLKVTSLEKLPRKVLLKYPRWNYVKILKRNYTDRWLRLDSLLARGYWSTKGRSPWKEEETEWKCFLTQEETSYHRKYFLTTDLKDSKRKMIGGEKRHRGRLGSPTIGDQQLPETVWGRPGIRV